MRIACFSPLPPSATGVAGYMMDLLPRWMARAEMEIFVEDRRSFLAHPGYPIFPCEDFEARRRKRPFDACFYHVGNNILHRFAYQAALRPGAAGGIVVLHDALVQHLLLGISQEAWEKEFAFAYGERGREIAANLRGGNPAIHEGFFRYPLVKRLVEASRAVIVHNQGAAARVEREAPGARPRVVPLAFVRRGGRGRESSRIQARRDLGLPSGAFLVGFLGYIRETRRLGVALRAFEALRRHVPQAEFLLVGESASPELSSFLEARLSAPGIRRTGYVSDQEFEQYAVACDVVVNLRFPSAGESSAVAVRSMGLGVPVVVSEIAENAAFPEDACLKVPPGEMEDDLLLEYLTALARRPELGQAIGENARRFILREHNPERCADLYMEVLREAKAASSVT